MRINEYINGIQVNDSNNINELEIELNFDNDNNRESVSLTNFEFGVGDSRFSNDSYTILKKVLNDGINGGVGVVEGVPFLVEIDNEKGTKKNLIDGYIDLWGAEFSNGMIKANVVPSGGIDWLNDKVDSFTFEYLESIGLITSDNYVNVPYCINKKSNTIDTVILIVTIYFISDKIISEIESISETGASASNPLEATAIVRLVLKIAYVAVLILTLVELIYQLYISIVQPVKYHLGMYVSDMIEIGCKHLGLTFSSSILKQYPFNKMLIIPEKYSISETNSLTGIFGNTTKDIDDNNGYYKGTFGDLLRALKLQFNAKILIQDNVLYFEKYDFTLSSPKFQLPDLLDSRYEYSLNKEDYKSNYVVTFAYDLDDKNTIQEWTGTNYQVYTIPIFENDKLKSLSKGLTEARIPFALGKVKTELNNVEQILSVFFDAINTSIDVLVATVNAVIIVTNTVIAILNSIIDAMALIYIDLDFKIPEIPELEFEGFTNLLEDRIGMLKIETDYLTIPKIILYDNGLMSVNSEYLSAKYLYENYHYLSSFVTGNNQYLLKSFSNINFNFNDFSNVLNNNRIFGGNGDEAILLSLKFNPLNEKASGTYKIRQTYLTNLKEVKIEPDGK